MKTGLVLEGGALRTIFSSGVCDALLDGGRIVEESYDAQAFFEHPQTERAQQFLHTFEFE